MKYSFEYIYFQIVFYADCSDCDNTVSYIKSLITPEIQEYAIKAIEGWINCPDDGAICDLNPDEVIDFLDNFDFCGVLQNHPQGDDVCDFIDHVVNIDQLSDQRKLWYFKHTLHFLGAI